MGGQQFGQFIAPGGGGPISPMFGAWLVSNPTLLALVRSGVIPMQQLVTLFNQINTGAGAPGTARGRWTTCGTWRAGGDPDADAADAGSGAADWRTADRTVRCGRTRTHSAVARTAPAIPGAGVGPAIVAGGATDCDGSRRRHQVPASCLTRGDVLGRSRVHVFPPASPAASATRGVPDAAALTAPHAP